MAGCRTRLYGGLNEGRLHIIRYSALTTYFGPGPKAPSPWARVAAMAIGGECALANPAFRCGIEESQGVDGESHMQRIVAERNVGGEAADELVGAGDQVENQLAAKRLDSPERGREVALPWGCGPKVFRPSAEDDILAGVRFQRRRRVAGNGAIRADEAQSAVASDRAGDAVHLRTADEAGHEHVGRFIEQL